MRAVEAQLQLHLDHLGVLCFLFLFVFLFLFYIYACGGGEAASAL
jgi:hypothetical protein